MTNTVMFMCPISGNRSCAPARTGRVTIQVMPGTRTYLDHLDLETLLFERNLTEEVMQAVSALPVTEATVDNMADLEEALDLVEEELDRREVLSPASSCPVRMIV